MHIELVVGCLCSSYFLNLPNVTFSWDVMTFKCFLYESMDFALLALAGLGHIRIVSIHMERDINETNGY